MVRIKPLKKEEVSSEIRSIFDEMEKTFGMVPNLFATIAHYPPILKPIIELYEALTKHSSLSSRIQELANLEVSRINRCHYCLSHHKKMAEAATVSEKEIENLLKEDYANFSDKEKTVIEYAASVTRDAENVSKELFSRLQKFFSDKEIVNLTLIIGLMNVFNRFNGALGVELEESFI